MKEQIKSDYELLSAFWQFWKAHDNVQPLDDDAYWDALLEDANQFAEEHMKVQPYAKPLIISLLREFERRAKEPA